eukprot:gene2303-4477_t
MIILLVIYLSLEVVTSYTTWFDGHIRHVAGSAHGNFSPRNILEKPRSVIIDKTTKWKLLGTQNSDSDLQIYEPNIRRPFNLTALKFSNDIQCAPASRDFVQDTKIAFNGPSSYQVWLNWKNGPKRVLIISKPEKDIYIAVEQSIRYLRNAGVEDNSNNIDIIHDIKNPLQIFEHELIDSIDLTICFGGDGLIMHANTLFVDRSIPPLMCFDFGSLGFLAPFNFDEFKVSVTTFHVLNEAVIDRGPSPYLCNLDLYCDDQFLTTVQADGLIIATPTGSTAYSLSAGGSMVHPSVPAFLLTPICAHTLSFRPIVLPDSCVLKCVIPADGRGTGWVSFDGKFRQELKCGDSLEISMSPYPMPTVNKLNFTADWFESLRCAFMFNQRPRQKPLTTENNHSSSSS